MLDKTWNDVASYYFNWLIVVIAVVVFDATKIQQVLFFLLECQQLYYIAMLRLQIHLIHLLIYFKFVASVSDGYASFKSVKCSASDEFAYKNFSCFAKSFSRTMSTINIDISLKNPLDEFYVILYCCRNFDLTKRFLYTLYDCLVRFNALV